MNKKTIISIVVCVAAFGLAAGAYFSTKPASSGISEYKGQIVYLKCSNPQCGHVQQMDKSKYFGIIHNKYQDFERPVLECEKCGSLLHRSLKCPKCSEIFVRGSIPNDVIDRCSKCSYSEIEQTAK